MPSLVKIPLILVTAALYHGTFTAPVMTETEEEQKRALKTSYVSFTERLVPAMCLVVKSLYWIMSAAEIASVLALRYPAHPLSPDGRSFLLLNSHGAQLLTIGTLTPTYLIGSSLIITGSLIRLRCFHEMGRHFTFRLSLLKDHKLITTGPYGIVRHPSYTAGLMTTLGYVLTLGGSGSWWKEIGGLRAAGLFPKICAGVLGASAAFCFRVFIRGGKEDEYLRKEFREQWDEWARRVRYLYLPGVY